MDEHTLKTIKLSEGMKTFTPPKVELWTGRPSGQEAYLHEKVKCIDLYADQSEGKGHGFAILGYACDEGVRRNQGRPGAAQGPDAIRVQLAKLPNHLDQKTHLWDTGTIGCTEGDMEMAQAQLATRVTSLLQRGVFPVLIGGGHDMAYGHFQGIKRCLAKNKTIGIINFDAHFDLRANDNGNTSGTPFYQVARELMADHQSFKYLCLGIREDANDKILFKRAAELGVEYMRSDQFTMYRLEQVKKEIRLFTEKVDHLYVTIDLDGFSSAYAPGVSAASPMGFSPDIVQESLNVMIESKKLISVDVAEMSPAYDKDGQTAKLAASMLHYIIHKVAYSSQDL